MLIVNTKFALLLVLGFSIAACETIERQLLGSDPQFMIDAGATRLDGQQARTHVSGKTEFWKEGTLYYDPDGQLDLVWRKVKSTGKWEVSADGDVCLQVPKWQQSCHYYLNDDGKIITVKGKYVSGVYAVLEGKKLPRR